MPRPGTRLLISVWPAAIAILASTPALAIRPFVTDDARVVGDKLAQLETWVLLDRTTLQHNALVAFGPSPWLEVTYGVLHGGVHTGVDTSYSIAGPILQLKGLVLPAKSNSLPGVALSAGGIAPLGHGPFTPAGWTGFTYLALTENLFDERLLLHANLGFAAADAGSELIPTVTAGFGFQARVVAGFHAVAEVFYGDPYDPESAAASAQIGFRYIFNDDVQVDGTFGTTLEEVAREGGRPRTEQWGTLGLRLVTPKLW